MTNTAHAIHDPAHWDSVSERYAAEAEKMTGRYADAAWELAGVPAGGRVLDVATGTGALLTTALKHDADAIGIDFSPGMVRVAQERAEAIQPGVRALVMDGQQLEFAAGGFDAVFSIFGVFMFPDPAAGFAEMARVLRPGGQAIVAVWENAGGAGPAQLFQQAAKELFPDQPVPLPMSRLFNSAELLDAAFVEGGLTPKAVHEVKYAWPAPTPEWFRDNAKLAFGWSPMWRELSDADRERFSERTAELAQALPADGIWSTALIGIATKPA